MSRRSSRRRSTRLKARIGLTALADVTVLVLAATAEIALEGR